jgi:hypothetical protein
MSDKRNKNWSKPGQQISVSHFLNELDLG